MPFGFGEKQICCGCIPSASFTTGVPGPGVNATKDAGKNQNCTRNAFHIEQVRGLIKKRKPATSDGQVEEG